MGVFNDVIIKEKIPCPSCGSELGGWQTKHMMYAGYDLANTLQQLKLNKRMTGSIHTSCDNCKEWVEYGVIKGKLVSMEEYEKYIGKCYKELSQAFSLLLGKKKIKKTH